MHDSIDLNLQLMAVEPCEAHKGWVEVLLLSHKYDIDKDVLDIMLNKTLPEQSFTQIPLTDLYKDIRDHGAILDFDKYNESDFSFKITTSDIDNAEAWLLNGCKDFEYGAAWDEGVEAYKKGLIANPYPKSDLTKNSWNESKKYLGWNDGFHHAQY